jgi:hypothetical protein
MATKQKSRASQPVVWNPDKTAIDNEHIAGTGVAMIRHPHHPFTAEISFQNHEDIQREAPSDGISAATCQKPCSRHRVHSKIFPGFDSPEKRNIFHPDGPLVA